jgi:hypothetical protein
VGIDHDKFDAMNAARKAPTIVFASYMGLRRFQKPEAMRGLHAFAEAHFTLGFSRAFAGPKRFAAC